MGSGDVDVRDAGVVAEVFTFLGPAVNDSKNPATE
jgi:hypothetical protein